MPMGFRIFAIRLFFESTLCRYFIVAYGLGILNNFIALTPLEDPSGSDDGQALPTSAKEVKSSALPDDFLNSSFGWRVLEGWHGFA
jgi:hypothetical protein